MAKPIDGSQQVSCEALLVQQGELYAALHRLEQQGWIKSERRPADTGRMAKFCSLSRSGRRQYQKELETWIRLSTAINPVVQEG
jgi:PadR family transcriptional regulator, regulatory protein PadR